MTMTMMKTETTSSEQAFNGAQFSLVERCFWEAEVARSNRVAPTLIHTTTMDDIPFYTVEHWQENWEELMDRVEKGETLGIINEDGNKAVMVPADDELIRLYTDHEEGS